MTWTVKMADARYDGYEEGFTAGREDGLQAGLQQGIEQGLKQGIEQGLEQGAYENKLETAKSLLTEGLPPEIISRCTNLPLETVLALSKNIPQL